MSNLFPKPPSLPAPLKLNVWPESFENQDLTALQQQVTELTQKIDEHKADTATDSHKIANITGLQTELDTKLNTTSLNTVKTVYVRTTGDDTTGDGSSGNPYATIKKAIDSTVGSIVVDISGQTLTITEPIYVINRYIGFNNSSSGGATINKTSTGRIDCINSSINMSRITIYADGNIFYVSGNCAFNFGGYNSVAIKPSSNVDVNVFCFDNINPGLYLEWSPSLISFVSRRLNLKTDNVSGYDSVFNVFNNQESYYVSPIILIRYLQLTKDATVKWIDGTDVITQIGTTGVYVA